MIAWFYYVVRFLTVITTSHQKKSEGTKTIVDTSNRFRVSRDVEWDDFMQYVMSLGTEQLPSRLAAPPRRLHDASLASRSVDTTRQQRVVDPVTKSQNPTVKFQF